MAIPGDIGIIGALALELIKMLKPDQLKQVQKKINELEGEQNEKRQELLQAIKSGDIDTINRLIGKYLQ